VLYFERGELLHVTFGAQTGVPALRSLLDHEDIDCLVTSQPSPELERNVWQDIPTVLESLSESDEPEGPEAARSVMATADEPRAVMSVDKSPHAMRVAGGRWRETALVMGGALALIGVLMWRGTAGHAAGKAHEDTDRAAKLMQESANLVLPAAKDATIQVAVHIEASGTVSETKIEKPDEALKDLEPRAAAAARQYRFTPALKGGVATDGWLTVGVRFTPQPNVHRLAIRGSETIGSVLGPALARALEERHPEIQVEIEALGSSTGFAGLFDGSCDVAAASRPIKAQEEELAKKLGIELHHALIGHDGIAVIAHTSNTLPSMDMSTLAGVFAGRITRWSQLGLNDAPIRALGRPSYSGTHAFFKERVLSTLGPSWDFGDEVTPFESSQALVGRVVEDPRAIGYVSLSHVIPSVRIMPIKATGKDAAVAASPTSVRDGSYPISRPLMLYWRANPSDEVHALLDLALSAQGQNLVEHNGFVALSPSEENPDAKAVTAAAPAGEKPAADAAKPQSVHIYFDQAKSTVTAEGRAELEKLAPQLKGGRRAVVVGNSDAAGDEKTNAALAKRRGDAVVAMLRSLGVAEDTMTVAIANDRPLATNDTVEGRKENRRVDILLF
jgi:phosphate transport system substrate-binding protein